jgi:hypothetical protein
MGVGILQSPFCLVKKSLYHPAVDVKATAPITVLPAKMNKRHRGFDKNNSSNNISHTRIGLLIRMRLRIGKVSREHITFSEDFRPCSY